MTCIQGGQPSSVGAKTAVKAVIAKPHRCDKVEYNYASLSKPVAVASRPDGRAATSSRMLEKKPQETSSGRAAGEQRASLDVQ